MQRTLGTRLTKRLCSLRHRLVYSFSRINIYSVVNKTFEITEGIIFSHLIFMVFRRVDIFYFQQFKKNKHIMLHRSLALIFYKKRASKGQNISAENRKWVKNVKL